MEWDGSSSASGKVLAEGLPLEVYDSAILDHAFADGSVMDSGDKLDPFAPNGGGQGDRL